MTATPNTRELAWWSESQLAAFSARLDDALVMFGRAWGLALEPGTASWNGHEAPSDGVTLTWWVAEGCWLGLPVDLEKHLGAALFSLQATPLGELESAVSTRARAALTGALGQALGVGTAWAPTAAPDDAQDTPWSGAVRAVLPVGKDWVRLRLSPEKAAALLGAGSKQPRPAQDTLRPAALFEAVTVRVSAELKPAKIAVGDLAALSVGDVLRLPHRLDAPLTLEAPGVPPLSAWLGQCEGVRAVRLAPPDDADTRR